ncbi:endolytic transglycosylase MltG [Kitasatospora sp. NPDC054939]
MTDLGRGYGPQGSEWDPGDPGYGGQQQIPGRQDGPWQQHPPYGGADQGRPAHWAPQAVPPQGMPAQGMPAQGIPPQAGSGHGLAGGPQQVPWDVPGGHAPPQQHLPPQQQYAPPQAGAAQGGPWQQEAPAPVQVAGPGPDGIDWEAEAAALEAGGHPADIRPGYADEPGGAGPEEDEAAAGQDASGERDGLFGDGDRSREARRRSQAKGQKSRRRNGGACLVVALVLIGATGGACWWGYGVYQDRFGPAPDFVGQGSGSARVEIKKGAVGSQMGAALKEAGVVKSVKAFTDACAKNPKCTTIQPGTYRMPKEMSAEAAVANLVEANGGEKLIIQEGLTSTATYAKIDEKLQLPKGTTAAAAKARIGDLGLPAYARGNIEGFLWPARYSISEGMKPEELLKDMVKNAVDRYAGLDAEAARIGLKSGYEVVIEASILQAEGDNPADFAKMARTIQNRLADKGKINGKLGMDTTLQYALGRKVLSSKDIHDASNKYNTYYNPGLPPGPISNPGEDAIKATLNPADGKWLYFIAMPPNGTKFAETDAEHAANVEAYCTAKGQKFDKVAIHCTAK